MRKWKALNPSNSLFIVCFMLVSTGTLGIQATLDVKNIAQGEKKNKFTSQYKVLNSS